MKKLIITLAITLGMGLTTFAQTDALGGGLLQRGETRYDFYADWADLGWTRTTSGLFNLPDQHGLSGDYSAPMGNGIALLAALGGAYLVVKRRKEE